MEFVLEFDLGAFPFDGVMDCSEEELLVDGSWDEAILGSVFDEFAGGGDVGWVAEDEESGLGSGGGNLEEGNEGGGIGETEVEENEIGGLG